jgi:ketosteroid isomerase-like protein
MTKGPPIMAAQPSHDTDAHRRENLQLLELFFALLNAKDIDGWAGLWADDARLLVPYPPPGFPDEITGKAEIVPGLREVFGHFDRYRATVRETYPSVDPDVIVVEWAVEADLTNGQVYRGENITVFKLRGGLIAEYHDYFDPVSFGVVVDALSEG